MHPRRWSPWWDWFAALTVAAVVLGPGLRPGFLLRIDLVTVPRPVATDDTWGLGDRLPRAVPWDGAMWLASKALPDRYLGQLALLAALTLAGVGAARLARAAGGDSRDTATGSLAVGAALVAGLVAIWNPFVLEQLSVGHVPHLFGYAAVPWVLVGLLAPTGRAAPMATAVSACALGSLTPGGGLLMVGTAIVAALAQWPHRRRTLVVAGWAILLQTPWVLAALVHPAVGAATGGTALFNVRAETPLGVVFDVLGLGGIWAQDAVPTSRATWLAVASTVLLIALSGTGVAPLRHSAPRIFAVLMTLGVVGWLIALLPVLPGSAPLVEALSALPGGGLLRDGHRWLAWPAMLIAVGSGFGAASLARTASRRWVWSGPAALVVVAAAVVAVLPDLALGLSGRLRSHEYPADWATVRAHLDAAGAEQGSAGADQTRLLSLPWQPFRRFAWAGSAAVLDPAPRAFPRAAVVDDTLTVRGVSIVGEAPAAARISAALSTTDSRVQSDLLRREGVGWILVEHGTAGSLPALPPDAVRVVDGHDLTLYRLPGVQDSAGTSPRWRRPLWQRQLVLAGHLGAAGIAAGSVVIAGVAGWRRRRGG